MSPIETSVSSCFPFLYREQTLAASSVSNVPLSSYLLCVLTRGRSKLEFLNIFPSKSDIPSRTISILQSLLKTVQHIDINGIQKICKYPKA